MRPFLLRVTNGCVRELRDPQIRFGRNRESAAGEKVLLPVRLPQVTNGDSVTRPTKRNKGSVNM